MGYINENDNAQEYDNLLLWGEASKTAFDSKTGKPLTMFRGGRKAALRANINMRKGRGRFISLLDVIHDGLLDLFVTQDRSISNDITPGYLLINQGNRVWRKDESMQEYSRTLMLTDADGDGFANEIVLNRSFCFPHRNGPDVDESYPQFGKFSFAVKKFCQTRPVGTTAIYKYNDEIGTMEDISKPFQKFWAAADMQPTCCPHTSFDGSSNCNAISMTSADFDDDQLADQILLYKYKMEFYFSTDRQSEVEPVVGNPNFIGLRIEFPDYCGAAISVSVIDIDNNGHEEIFVTCENAGTFLVYTRNESDTLSPSYKSSWTLENSCNNLGTLGQINNRFLASPTKLDLNELCYEEDIRHWETAKNICKQYGKHGEIPAAKTSGIAIVDLNNDGFLDMVVTHTFGYLRFFYNIPLGATSLNRHISFDLSGEKSNGIGSTLVLHYKDSASGKLVKQFREISTFLHGTDKHSTKDAKITFGLGQNLIPVKLFVRWPDKRMEKQVQEFDLGDRESAIIKIQQQSNPPSKFPTKEPTNHPSPKPSPKPTQEPTSKPSPNPTSKPSFQPTAKPTPSPSTAPSSTPTASPSDFPTNSPTSIPTSQPSRSASPTVSRRPSDTPSISDIPSGVPSTQKEYRGNQVIGLYRSSASKCSNHSMIIYITVAFAWFQGIIF